MRKNIDTLSTLIFSSAGWWYGLTMLIA